MTQNSNVQPIFIMPEGSQRSTGKTAQRNNIMAAKLVSETVRTTLGPKGMDKMLVDNMNDVVVTNDGVTILKEMQIEHPAAKMIVEVAKTQEDEVGDGTTTAVVLAGELLKQAEYLLDQEVHPTILARGYRLATEKTMDILGKLAEPVAEKDTEVLKKIAMTAMTGKGAENAKELLADIAAKAVKQVAVTENDKLYIDRNDIKIEKKVGSGVENTELITGIVLDKEKVHAGMPRMAENAKIALLDCPLEIKSTETDAKISINDPTQMQAFLDQEEKMLREMAQKIADTGVTAVFVQKGIDDLVQHFLAKNNIYACRRVKKSDIEALAKATGANIISNLHDLTANDLGNAGVIEEVKVGDEEMTYVKACKNPKSVTILVRGGTEHVADEIKRAVTDAIGDIAAALKDGKVVGGAGAPEIEVAKDLRKYANKLEGREQLAVQAFATAMEIIPRTLAENGGLDPIDVLTDLKAAHDSGKKWAGVNVFTGKVMDAWRNNVIEPLKIKTQAVSSAAEVAIMILRIDDVISAGGVGGSGGPPDMGGMPPGMPPMGGMGGMPGM